ncbi:hypothetical protein HNR71_001582 [Kribbella sandramycini]|uniref:Uncharacterized protein n=1 Tax=Kribbella sandramycini TaxID=60450 RepID=A0A841S924_9ACTN|nr:hypothetical protein [Kribbella sandramycini]
MDAGPLRQELQLAAARRVDHGLFRTGLALRFAHLRNEHRLVP